MIKLIVIDGPDLGREFTLTSEVIVIGRSRQCNLMLHDAALGRRHCEIRRKDNAFILVDLTSVNGTYLNNRTSRVTSEILYDKDEIFLGKSRLRVELPGHDRLTHSPLLSADQELPPPQLPERRKASTVPLTPPSPQSPPSENRDRATPSSEFTLIAGSPDPPLQRLSLQITEGNDKGKVVEISSEVKRFTVGRGDTADWVLNDRHISRIHFAIESTPAGFVFVDESSRNGTFLRGQSERLHRLPLHGGEEILLGETCLRVAILAATGTLVVPPVEQPTWRMRLRVVAGREVGKVIDPGPKTKHFTIGRDNSADFVLDDLRISRVHVTIELTPTGFILLDENSRNGTFIKGQTQRVKQLPLRGGEEIQLGETVLQIEITEPVEGTQVAPLPYAPLPRSSGRSEARRLSLAEQSSPRLPESVNPLPRSWVVLGSSFLTLLCCLTLVWFGKPTVLSSAALSAVHAQWEENCLSCHSPWGMKPMNASCGTVECHGNDLQVAQRVSDQCEQCHTEHRGRRFAVRGDASQCWQCHASGFPDRPVWRYYKTVYRLNNENTPARYRLALPASEGALLTWKNSAPTKETGLIFAHAAHAKTSKQQECLACHQPLPGTIINALGAPSAFPTHDDCIECHREVGDRDPQRAQQNSSTRCQKCHTRADGQITRVQRTLAFVRFSHDDHSTTDCETCHFAVKEEQTYLPGTRSTVYALPMEACVSCHQQKGLTSSCVDCHRTHHRIPALPATAQTKKSFLSLNGILLGMLALQIGGGAYLYMRSSSSPTSDE